MIIVRFGYYEYVVPQELLSLLPHIQKVKQCGDDYIPEASDIEVRFKDARLITNECEANSAELKEIKKDRDQWIKMYTDEQNKRVKLEQQLKES